MEREDIIAFIKDNYLLFIGFCIPLIIFAMVMLVQAINRSIIRDPLYGAVFVADYDGFARYKPYTVLVEHGRLVIEKNEKEPDSERELDYSQYPAVFYFDNKKLTTRRLNIDFSKVSPNGKIVSQEINDINAGKPLITDRMSPDGYMFSYRSGKADQMVAGLFASSFQHQGNAIYKGSKIINIVYEGKRITDPQFLAWVDKNAEKKK